MNENNPTQIEQNAENLEQHLHKNSLLRLGEMLKVLRQGDSKESRQKIKTHCLELSTLGKKAQLPKWVQLMEMAAVAIADTNNQYIPTVKLIIKEIKQASEWVTNQQADQIKIDGVLSKLVPDAFFQALDLETIGETIDKSKISKETVSRDLWRDTQTVIIEDEEEDLEQQINPRQTFSASISADLSRETNIIDNYFAKNNSDESIDDWFDNESGEDNDNSEDTSSVFLKEQEHPTLNNYPDEESLEEIERLFEDNAEVEKQDLEDDVFDLLEDFEEISTEIQEHNKTEPDQEIARLDLDDLFKETLTLDDDDDNLIPTSIPRSLIDKTEIAEFTDQDFEELETAAEGNFWLKQEHSLDNNLFYEPIEELETLIDAEITTRRFVNWQKLSNLLFEDHLSSVDIEIEDLFRQTLIIDLDQDQINQQRKEAELSLEVENPELNDFDQLEQLLVQAQSSQTKKQKWKNKLPQNQQQPPPKTFEATMRVPVKQLDSLNNLVGEMVVRRNRLEEDQDRLRLFLDNLLGHVQNLSDVGTRMQDLYERSLLEGALLASRERNKARIREQIGIAKETRTNINNNNPGNLGLDDLELDHFSEFHLLSQDIIELIVRVRESTSDIQFLVDETEQLGRNLRQVTTQLQEEINKSRMVAFAQTADRLPRAVRDISIFYQKQIELKVEGREVLIDKMILEHLWDPIQQLVKNAITHGIEVPKIRQKKGKSKTGIITIRTFLQGPQTVISISDDGAGIDPEKVKQKAIRNKLITKAQAANISTQDIYDFLFSPGFSTKEEVDSHAGRGVGLDIVRSKLNEIRGTVTINSNLDKGTTFTIRLPLTLSIGKALCCINDNGRIAFPMDGIEDTKEYSPQDIEINQQGERSILWQNNLLPLRPLNTLLTHNRQTSRSIIYSNSLEEESISVVILRGGNNLLAVQVDQIIGEEEIVIKQISGPLPKPKGIAGATVRSDGIVMPIGDVIELIDIASGNISKDIVMDMFPSRAGNDQTLMEVPTAIEPLVLIVDDSITVREMLSMSFSKAGYLVEQARDGQEAWQKLRSGLACDIVFCDIEMPRMNGLELLQNIQEDPSLADIPVAVLSSRGAEKHQQIAAELGASAYLIKPYVEKDLIDSAQKMIDGEVLLANSTKKSKFRAGDTQGTELESAKITKPHQNNQNNASLVLIIDDSVVVREMLSITFKKAGYQVEQARDGQDAWDKITDGLQCDIILCDIEMPRMNGLELLAKMQQDEKLAEIPVAMVTSRGAEKHRKIAADLGAKAYFTKPYLEEELLDATNRLIQGDVLLNIV